MRKLEVGEKISTNDLVTAKRNIAFACQLALAAGTRLFNHAGGRALYTSSPMQRQFRNLLGAVSHYSLVWDWAAAEYGAFILERYLAPRDRNPEVD